MRKKLFANWGIKLISLLAAFSLWFAVIYIDDPPEEETFTNIPVHFLNTELLSNQGLVYEVLDNTDVVRQVTVKGPKTVLGEVNKDSIIATADFSEKNMSDIIDIELEVVNEYDSALEISATGGKAQLKLFVEEKTSRSIPVNVNIIGEVAAGHQIGTAKTDQNRVTVTGGRSKVEMVSYAAVTVDVTGSTTDISTTEVIRLYDKDHNLLDTDKLQKNINSTKTNVTVLSIKTVPVEFDISGEVAEGYLLTGDRECDIASLKIAGTPAALFDVNSIRIPAEELDVTGLTSDLVRRVDLKEYLPSGVQIAKDGGTGVAEIRVYIEKEEVVDLKVIADNIAIANVPEGFEAKIEEPYTIYDIRVKGLKRNVSKIVESRLGGVVDVKDWMKEQGLSTLTELPDPVCYIPIGVLIPEGVEVIVPAEARITFFRPEEILE